MKQITIFLCCFLPQLIFAQASKDAFKDFENWEQVLTKAKANNKNIFIDAYATWCGPCKEMDANVYTDKLVQRILDSNFISIKVQMDKTKNDPSSVANWYNDAAMLSKKFHIDVFPTFIFLSPDGDLIQINKGYQDAAAFVKILSQANDSQHSYAYLIKKFNLGKIVEKEVLSLSLKAIEYHDDSLAFEMAKVFKQSYFDKVPLTEALKPNLPEFISNFPSLFTVYDRLFKFCYEHPSTADSLVNYSGFSGMIVNFYITLDIVNPIMKNAENNNQIPDWEKIRVDLARKYNSKTAEAVTASSRLGWYHKMQDWPNIVKYEVEKIEKNGIDTAGLGKAMLNNMVYNIIFKHSEDLVYLNKGLEYMRILIKSNPKRDTWLDTYANLLYKSGRTTEALKYQEMALALAKQKNDQRSTKEYEKKLHEMKNAQPTWLEN